MLCVLDWIGNNTTEFTVTEFLIKVIALICSLQRGLWLPGSHFYLLTKIRPGVYFCQ